MGWIGGHATGEALVVVPGLPVPKGGGSDPEVLEALATPELLLIDPMAPLTLPFCCGRRAGTLHLAT